LSKEGENVVRKVFIVLFLFLGWTVVGQAETIVYEDDFSSWDSGTIDSGYSLPSGWSNLADGMVVSTQNAVTGTQTLKSPNGSLASLRYDWSAVDPTGANPVKITLHMRLGTQGKVEKGAVLMNSTTSGGGCGPAVYWYEYPADPIGSRRYRVRDRAGCTGPPYDSVYSGGASLYEESSDNLRKMVIWELVCSESNALLYKDGVLVHTYAGAPNGDMDNFLALEIGAARSNWWGNDMGTNGDLLFDYIKIAQGPFDPTPTPTDTPTPTITPTPTETPMPVEFGPIFREDFEVADISSLLAKGWTVPNGDSKLSINTSFYVGGEKSLKSDGAAEGQYIQREWAAPAPSDSLAVTYNFWIRPKLSSKIDKYVNEKKDPEYQALLARYLVAMETNVFVGLLMLRDALKDSEREVLAERYILDAIPEFNKSYEVVMSGDVTLIDNHRDIIDY